MDSKISCIIILMANLRHFQADTQRCHYSENTLDCSKRGLTKIPDNIPPNVRSIDLSRNNIKEIEENTFQNLTRLEEVSLSYNLIGTIKNCSFSGLPKLRVLNIERNVIRNVGEEAFDYLPSLIELKVNSNPSFNQVFVPSALKRMKQVHKIAFDGYSGFQFSSLHMLLPHVYDLEIYVGSCCYALRNHTFDNANSNQIRKLFVTVTNIEHGSFCHLKGIKELYINIYLYADIMDDIFESLHCLENGNIDTLQIYDNKKSVRLTERHLRPLSKVCIKRLWLTKNSISEIDVTAFEQFARRSFCLEYLDLSKNHIPTFSFAWFFMFSMFQNLQNIRIVQFMDRNSIRYQCSSADYYDTADVTFSLPLSLRELHFTDIWAEWRLSSITARGASNLTVLELSNVAFCAFDLDIHGLQNLKHLDTSGWHFVSVKHNFLQSVPNLETYISENSFLGKGLRHNDNMKDFLLNTTKLQHINLHGNDLETLPADFFNPVINTLKTLNLSNNLFTELPLVIQAFPYLRYLDLRNNSFTEIKLMDREALSKETNLILYLSGNPFLCICDTLPFLMWQNFSVIEDYIDLVCTTESGHRIHISDVRKEIQTFEQHCMEKTWIVLGLCLSCTVILAGVVYYRFRFLIQYECIMLRRCMSKTSERTNNFELDDATNGNSYDVFFVYCEFDLKSVIKIYKLLEQENIKIAMDHITFVPGDSKVDGIIDAIDNSRKIIIFVTNHFLENEVKSYEMEMARIHAFGKDKKVSVIVVIKEYIPINKLPKALKIFCDTGTCIKWPSGYSEDRQLIFHKDLIEAVQK